MNAVSLTSSFPATVQPGIPKLGETPTGWTRAPLGRFLREIRRPIKMADDETYKLVTVKRARGGVVDRGSFLGRDVLVKSQFKIEAGDFLISKRQIVHGACGLVPEKLSGSIVSNEYAVLNGNDGIDTTFLNYLAHSIYFQQTCFHSSIGVHVEKMIFKLDRWLKFDFNLPPLPEQQKIADILSTWDAAIEKTEALLATSKAQKRALMQSLLTGKRRFPEFEGQPWKEVRLGDVATIAMGSSPKSSAYNNEGVGLPLIQGNADVKNGRSAPRTFTSEITTRCSPNDILLSVRAPVGSVAISDHNACVGRGAAVIRPIAGHDWFWLKHLMLWLEPQWVRVSQGSTFEAVNSKDLKTFKMPMPSTKEEEGQIGSAIESAHLECDSLMAQIAKLRTEKKALMQQLLTGKRRVVV